MQVVINFAFSRSNVVAVQVDAIQHSADAVGIDTSVLLGDDVVVMNDRPAELPSDGDDVMREANRHRLPSDAVESLRQFELSPFRLGEKVAGAAIAQA